MQVTQETPRYPKVYPENPGPDLNLNGNLLSEGTITSTCERESRYKLTRRARDRRQSTQASHTRTRADESSLPEQRSNTRANSNNRRQRRRRRRPGLAQRAQAKRKNDKEKGRNSRTKWTDKHGQDVHPHTPNNAKCPGEVS